jgi:hypothetical protein
MMAASAVTVQEMAGAQRAGVQVGAEVQAAPARSPLRASARLEPQLKEGGLEHAQTRRRKVHYVSFLAQPCKFLKTEARRESKDSKTGRLTSEKEQGAQAAYAPHHQKMGPSSPPSS